MSSKAENSAPSTAAATPTRRTFGEPWPEFNDGLTYHDLVRPSDAGLTLIEFYSRKYKNSAPLQGDECALQSLQITIDGSVVSNPDASLSPGAQLLYHRLPWKEPNAPYVLEVLFEDDDLIALNKPSGLQVLPGGLFQQRTVLTQLQWRASKLSSLSSSGEPHPVPVHRLGRGTSGILLCAKTKHAKSRLSAYFADGTSIVQEKRYSNLEVMRVRKIIKIYRALVSGVINEDEVYKCTVYSPLCCYSSFIFSLFADLFFFSFYSSIPLVSQHAPYMLVCSLKSSTFFFLSISFSFLHDEVMQTKNYFAS
nr:RNA pseudouridine synthase 5 isoform X2 [Ipomoea batatas]